MKRAIALLLLVGIVAAGVVYNIHARNAPSPATAAPPSAAAPGGPVPVTVATARRRPVRQTLDLVGTLRTDQQVTISARFPGRIAAVLVPDGVRVRRGQALVRLDLGGAQAQVAGAQAGVRAADAQYRKAIAGKSARATELDAQIAQAQGGLRAATAKLAQAELAVQLTASSAQSDVDRANAGVRQAEAGLRQAEAGLTQANETAARLRFLYAHGGAARADLDGAETQADIARAQRDAAVAALDQARAAAQPAATASPLRTRVSEADVSAARAGVAQAQAALRDARRARGAALSIADRDIEAARAQVAQARAGVGQAASQVGASVLTSPVDGTVTGLSAHAGDMAQPGQALMSVIAPGSVYLETAVNARSAGLLRPGDAARITLDTAPDQPQDGYVERILPGGADSRGIAVRIRIESRGVRPLAGTGATAEVDVARDARALTVPVSALRSEGSVSFVYAVLDGRAQRRNVTTGATEGSDIQVLSGLSEGDSVILEGPASLQSGTPVTVVGR